ncbi:RHTO0S16e02982g1_1 [Rhodotorula toruloides]|uniref:RHTO0S16e02982g1_1 n=2 Tax=Rhodotorula toruloides TaxID=5286 RepID=A0A061BE11_RHOTO|nr:uncharacterized protein RHTO_02287 [Rhodotorula toruloides NP11]EMS20992.1 hypothetical protein RHTO_02287 [Rhodotorula toruloides NP11]CDR48181.1 RHTO0S16e02982g1_1 [Rhodotorula toruloides]
MSSAEAALGPFYLGTLFQLFLFGIHWQQVFDYYRLFPTDRLAIKAAVAAVFVVGSFHISCSIYTVWFYAIAGYGQPSYIADCVWSFAHAQPSPNRHRRCDRTASLRLASIPRLEAVDLPISVNLPPHARSIRPRSLHHLRRRHHPSLVGSAPATRLGGRQLPLLDGSGRHPHHIRIEYAGYGSSSPATETELDLPLPPAYYLRQVKSDFGRTNSIIGRIIRLTVANNAITAVTAVCSGSLFVADNQAAYHVFFSLTIIHSYAISFLSSLKSRKTIASEIARGSDPTKDYVSPPPKAALSGPVNSPPGSGPESYELRNKMRFPRTRSLDSLDSAKLAPAEELVANNGGVPIKIRVATEIVSEKGTDSWEPQYFNPTSSALSSQYEPEIVSPTPPFTTSDRSAEHRV